MYDASRVCELLAKVLIRNLSNGEYLWVLEFIDGDPEFVDKLNQCLSDALTVVRPEDAERIFGVTSATQDEWKRLCHLYQCPVTIHPGAEKNGRRCKREVGHVGAHS